MPIRILVVDDHSVVRQGIITLLEDEDDLVIAGEAADGDEVPGMVDKVRPDLILLDLTMPRMSGIDVIREIVPAFPKVSILVFSMHNNPDYILAAALNGAAGYLQKDTSRDEMLAAIRSIARGELYYPPYASSIIIRKLLKQALLKPEPEPEDGAGKGVWNMLTPREQQILQCLVEGMSSREIAEKFDISANTVANQRASIMKKLNVRNTAGLISLTLK
ncbi:response regulator [Dyadobacter sandarakinus]|uniref:Response regulator transcription factor n=1 Tax=Dyadobacter sandarakinus TaxID=2747268 RepID=A0ABX7I5Y1_9BACT|nr:response regulator transcription factor [Dyadobacter sandarakinus]QRR00588.1 response regulator transcription factor [Dyadobacter sandarakinus]